MKYMLALSVTLIAFGIPSVANYFPLQTYAVMSALETASNQTASVISAKVFHKESEDVSLTKKPAPTMSPGADELDASIFPPRPI